MGGEFAPQIALHQKQNASEDEGYAQGNIHSRDRDVPMFLRHARDRDACNVVTDSGKTSVDERGHELQKDERPEQHKHQGDPTQDCQHLPQGPVGLHRYGRHREGAESFQRPLLLQSS